MTAISKSYLDANVIIRFVEGDFAASNDIRERLGGVSHFVTSHLSRLECRCHPMRNGDPGLLSAYDLFFGAKEMTLLNIDERVIDIATRLRATYAFKSPDAIHLASAIACEADCFLTGDTKLARCTEIKIELL